MDETAIHQDLKKKAIFLAEYAATLEAVGVQSSRIQYNTIRIAKSWGLWCNLLILPQTVDVTLHDEGREHSYTYVKKTPAMGLNFKINMELSHLSWRAFDEHLSLDDLWKKFNEIVNEPRESPWTVLILVSFANACFCRLFDGNYTSIAIVWIATFIGFFLKQQLLKHKWNDLAVFILCSFVSTMIGATDYLYFHGGTEDMSLGTSMLYLVPGVPIINGVMDIIDKHVLSGIARLTNACMLVVCIALGLTLTIVICGVNPLNFTKIIRPDIMTASIADGLFAAVAGTGFAIISNPPRKALFITACLACVGHSVRYFLMHDPSLMLDQVTASTFAGLVIGLLAVPAAMTIHYPAEGFAFPALLPMVPGMFAYKAIRDLINIVQLPNDFTMEYITRFFHNSTLTILVMFGMVAGCVIPIFIFHRQSYEVTRK
jgi:uncharacterized membrane protein YjjP (DUF1212 family)